ncbi:hypothetical protein GCM10010530_18850 [Kribbella aluminosa]
MPQILAARDRIHKGVVPGQSGLPDPDGDLGTVQGLELRPEAGDVSLDDAERDEQLGGDLVVGTGSTLVRLGVIDRLAAGENPGRVLPAVTLTPALLAVPF